MTETRPLGDVQAAYDRMLTGDARFRMVLTTGKGLTSRLRVKSGQVSAGASDMGDISPVRVQNAI